MRGELLGIVVLLASCGDNIRPPTPANGARLALRRFTFMPGPELIDRTRVRDLARDEDCAPERWSDGFMYCTPEHGEIVYVDNQCLTRAARLPIDSTAQYATETAFDGVAHLYRIDGPFNSTSSEVWHLVRGMCVGSFPTEPAATFAIDGEVPRDAFARITSTSYGAGRLQIVAYTSDDGLVLPSHFHDRSLAADCTAARAPGAATTSCVPTATPALYFADAACTQPVAEIATTTLPAALSYTDASGCPAYAALGAQVAASALFARAGCTPLQGDPAHRFFAAGVPLDLAPLTRTHEPTSDRIALVDLDDALVTDSLVHDGVFGVDCEPQRLGDGLACLPDAAHAETSIRYTDAACTNRIDIAIVPAAQCAAAPAFVVDLGGTWRAIAGRVTMPLYERDATGCIAASEAGDVVSVSAPLAPSAFVPVGVAP